MSTCKSSLKQSRAILTRRWNFPAAERGRESIAVFAGLCVCAALTLALRRVSGVLVHPLPMAALICTGFLAAITIFGIRMLRQCCPGRSPSSRGDLIMDIMLGMSLLIFAAALSLPGTSAWGLGCFWALIAASEIWAWSPGVGQWFRRLRGEKTGPEKFRIDQAQTAAAHIEPARMSPAAISDSLTMPIMPEKDVSQHLVRSSTAQGGDMLCGVMRLDFSAGQRTGNLHVAFCPPFAAIPEITAVQVDGPEARIKIAQLLPYGARMDVKLAEPSDQAAGVLVQITAWIERQR